MSSLFHAVITRFSIRNLFGSHHPDTLEPERLLRRFAILEALCAPSVMRQTNQDFTWIILTDANASEGHLSRLVRLARQRRRTEIIAFQDRETYKALEWLEPYVHGHPDYVLTTLLDDDDGLRTDHVQYLHDHVLGRGAIDVTPPLKFIGCENAVQWDLTRTCNAPLGFEKPWRQHDFLGRPYPTSAGLTLCARAGLSMSIFGCSHSAVPNACRYEESRIWQPEGLTRRVANIRGRVRAAAQSSGLDWDGTLTLRENYHACTLPGPQAVVCNHTDNARSERAKKERNARVPVRDGHSFAQTGVDFDRVREFLQ